MAKAFTFSIGGASYEAEPVKVERKKIYGYTEVRAATPEGESARQVSLDINGMTIIPKGAVKMVQTNSDGEWVDKSELTPKYADGSDVVKVPSSFDAPIELKETATEEDLLDHLIETVYQLETTPELIADIGSKIYTFPFSYRGGNSYDTAFLLTQGDNLFMMEGKKVDFEMVGLTEQAVLDDPDEVEEEESDELDFSMF